jgi:hypothetical protein
MEKGTQEYLEFRKKANISNRKYFSKPDVKAKKKIYKKKHDLENKEKISEYGFRLRARPEYKERIKKWREDNKEHLKEYTKSPERRLKKRISDKKYYLKIRNTPEGIEKDREIQRKFRKNNLDKIRKYNQKYYTSPKGIINYTHHNHRRISLMKERPFDLSNEKIRNIIERDKVCVYCGGFTKLELDHIIPLKLGGNSLFNNFVLACKKCNTSKSGRDVFKWCELQGIEVPKIVIELLNKQHEGV